MSTKDYLKEVLITNEQIVEYCKELAATLEADYEGKELHILCVLKGSVPFLAELSKHFTRDDINFEYIRASSYEGETTDSKGTVQLSNKTYDTLAGKDVLILEDIIDTGLTLQALTNYLGTEGAKSIKVATLLDKPERREVTIEADYVGFTIPNHFVIGFGLDYDEKYRNLKDIVIPYPDKI